MAAFQNRPPRKIDSRLPDTIEANRKAELVVWLLGAGFSKPLGGPLFSELLSERTEQWARAWFSIRGLSPERFPDGVANIYAHGQSEHLWENPEECLALIDEARLDRVAMAVIEAAFSRAIGKVNIERLWASMTHFVGAATSHYVDRVSTAKDLPEAWQPYLLWANTLSELDSIISFNYDRVVEHLLTRTGKRPAILAKLHGTVDEAKTLCGDIDSGVALSTIATPGPTKTRSMRNSLLEQHWSQAERALAQAHRLVVVGYSFPATDTFVRSFILSKSGAKKVDIVVGPDQCGETIAGMFARFLGSAAVCNTCLTAQQYLAEGTAHLKYERFNHWLPPPGRQE